MPKHFEDYYKILNLDPRCSAEEIKHAYKKKALETHPDKTNDITSKDFLQVQRAFECLSDPKERADYDKNWYLNASADGAQDIKALATHYYAGLINKKRTTKVKTLIILSHLKYLIISTLLMTA